jgi:hypothetical protein
VTERENEQGGPHYAGERGGESAGSEGGQGSAGDAEQPGKSNQDERGGESGVGGRGPTEREREPVTEQPREANDLSSIDTAADRAKDKEAEMDETGEELPG